MSKALPRLHTVLLEWFRDCIGVSYLIWSEICHQVAFWSDFDCYSLEFISSPVVVEIVGIHYANKTQYCWDDVEDFMIEIEATLASIKTKIKICPDAQ